MRLFRAKTAALLLALIALPIAAAACSNKPKPPPAPKTTNNATNGAATQTNAGATNSATTNGATKSETPAAPTDLTTREVKPQITLKIDDGTLEFVSKDLPAISKDGAWVALAYIDGDGGRGNPNLTVNRYDTKTGEIKDSVEVLDADEVEEAEDDSPELQAGIEKRLSKANAMLAGTTWRSMIPLEGTGPGEEWDEPSHATLGSGDQALRISYTEPHLELKWPARKLAWKARFLGWLSGVSTECFDGEDCLECVNPGFLGVVHLSPEHQVLLLDINYYGTDTCWEGSSTIDIVPLTGPPPVPTGPTVAGVPAYSADPVTWEATLKGQTENVKGVRALEAKDHKAAIKAFTAALSHNPEHLLSRYNLACAFALDAQPARAMDVLEQLAVAGGQGCILCDKLVQRAPGDADFAALLKDTRFEQITTTKKVTEPDYAKVAKSILDELNTGSRDPFFDAYQTGRGVEALSTSKDDNTTLVTTNTKSLDEVWQTEDRWMSRARLGACKNRCCEVKTPTCDAEFALERLCLWPTTPTSAVLERVEIKACAR